MPLYVSRIFHGRKKHKHFENPVGLTCPAYAPTTNMNASPCFNNTLFLISGKFWSEGTTRVARQSFWRPSSSSFAYFTILLLIPPLSPAPAPPDIVGRMKYSYTRKFLYIKTIFFFFKKYSVAKTLHRKEERKI